MVGQPDQRAGHGRAGGDFLQPPARPVVVGDPHAAGQFGLADVERGDPLDDLFSFLCLLQHRRVPPVCGGSGQVAARRSRGAGSNLILVLEATGKGPQVRFPAPDYITA